MTPNDFCYWLQGHFEMSEDKVLSVRQCKMVQDHLKLVFKKETPIFKDLMVTDPLGLKPHWMQNNDKFCGVRDSEPLKVTC